MVTPRAGFTIIELVVVCFILAIIAGMSVSAFLGYGERQQFRAATVDITAILKETRQRTLAAETSTQFGVVIATSSLTVFSGAYTVGGSGNRVYSFPGVTITPSLTNGTTTLVFARLTGMPNAYGTIVLLHERTNASTTITVSPSGLVW